MGLKQPLKLCLLFLLIPVTWAALVGTFFWKPRVGIDLSISTTESRIKPKAENIRNGIEVILNGYQVGITLMAIAEGFDERRPHLYLDPTRPYFYTNAYRWARRYISMLPPWLSLNSSYSETHRVWNKRYLHTESFVPNWMKYLFPYVTEDDWKNEENELRRFKKYAEKSFAKHYRFPSKRFNNYLSQESNETVEGDDSELSSSA